MRNGKLLLKWFVLLVLVVITGAMGSFAGCIYGANKGVELDKQAGTFGKGLEGSREEFIQPVLGIIGGGLLAGGLCFVAVLLLYRLLENYARTRTKPARSDSAND